MINVSIPQWEYTKEYLHNACLNSVSTDDLNKFLTTIKVVKPYAFQYIFNKNENLTGALYFPQLQRIEDYGMYYAFKMCENISGSISFPNLTYVGDYGLAGAFAGTVSGMDAGKRPAITSISFPKLTQLGNHALQFLISSSESITFTTEVHFPKALEGNTECTPSNLMYPSNKLSAVTVVFDL